MESHPFQSRRLSYHAITPSDEASLLFALSSDAVATMNATVRLPQPASAATTATLLSSLQQQLLAVKVCLRCPNITTPVTAQPSSSTSSGAGGHENTHVPAAAPTDEAIGFVTLSASPAQLCHHRSTELSVGILAPYRGQGYGTEAIEWALDYAFGLAGLHRVAIGCAGWNEGARRLYGRMGFVLEAKLRAAEWFRGRWWDAFAWAILEEEWRERRVLGRAGDGVG